MGSTLRFKQRSIPERGTSETWGFPDRRRNVESLQHDHSYPIPSSYRTVTTLPNPAATPCYQTSDPNSRGAAIHYNFTTDRSRASVLTTPPPFPLLSFTESFFQSVQCTKYVQLFSVIVHDDMVNTIGYLVNCLKATNNEGVGKFSDQKNNIKN